MQVTVGNRSDLRRIHPDFVIDFLYFSQNREWNSVETGPPQVKLAFCFEDPALLDGCPFVTKICVDVRGCHRYFGMAYGLESDVENLSLWGQKFPEAKLFTHTGSFLKRISPAS